jgi:hypothetical protein
LAVPSRAYRRIKQALWSARILYDTIYQEDGGARGGDWVVVLSENKLTLKAASARLMCQLIQERALDKPSAID